MPNPWWGLEVGAEALSQCASGEGNHTFFEPNEFILDWLAVTDPDNHAAKIDVTLLLSPLNPSRKCPYRSTVMTQAANAISGFPVEAHIKSLKDVTGKCDMVKLAEI
jgi:hypothetical protein